MKLSSTVHDCLYVNWAVELGRAPRLPSGLSYDHRLVNGVETCFVSILLFRQRGLHFASMPWLPLSHPQANLRLYVVDREQRPAVLFLAVWVPGWMSGVMRVLGRVPARPARLEFPEGPVLPELRGRWTVHSNGRFAVDIRPGGGIGREVGGWRQTEAFFRRRETGYLLGTNGLRRVDAVQPDADACPVAVEIEDLSLADLALEGRLAGARLQSAFLCEKLPFEFELVPGVAGQGALSG